jgi:choline dehydrogenase-like flavoprotein
MSSLRSGIDNCETDYYGKLKKFKNIFVSDASILPGNTGESPQASIMAYAKFVGKNII